MGSDALEFLRQILEIPSVNSRDQEGAVAEYLCRYFQAHRISASVQKIDETHANVTAFLPGKDRSRTVLWNGHLDTVPYGAMEEWRTDPQKPVEREGRLYARGASDMKSGLASMVYALCHLEEEPFCNIRFLGTCDEEKNGIGAEYAGKAGAAEDCRWMLIGEPTGMKLGTAQKGCLWLQLSVKGVTSHGAYPWEGVNAVAAAAALAEKIRIYAEGFTHPLLGQSTAQITMIQGGVAANMTPDFCRAVMDIRMAPGLTADMVIHEAQNILKREKENQPGLDASFEILNSRRAIEISEHHPMTSKLASILRDRGYDGGLLGINFFTDASVLDREGKKDILLFGPGEPFMAHKPNEYVEIAKYEDAIRILQQFAKEGGQE